MMASTYCGLTRAEMEARRLSAAHRFAAGLRQVQIAREFSVSRTTASRWHARLARGMDALRRRPTPGRPPRLTPAQLHELRPALHSRRWTRAAFAREIELRFGVRYNPDHVGKIMHRLGLPTRAQRARPRAQIGDAA